MEPLVRFIQRVQATGLQLPVVYDIGAWQGRWSQAMRSRVLPQSEFVLFEANPVYREALEQSGFKNFNVVLSNPGREYVDFFNGTNTGDSYYKETTKHYDGQGSIRLPCVTLDDLVQKNNLRPPNFIKIDTQGSELDILAGGASILRQVDLVYTECPIIRYNAGAPHIQDYLDFFRSHDFIPVDLLGIHRAEGTLLQIDIMFVRRETKERYLGKNDFIRPMAG